MYMYFTCYLLLGLYQFDMTVNGRVYTDTDTVSSELITYKSDNEYTIIDI